MPALVPWSNTPELKRSADRSKWPEGVTTVLGAIGPHGPALTGIRGTGDGGVGDVATPACRTGLPLNLLGSEATGAAAPGFAADISRTLCRSSAFSLSILSRRAITSSSVAECAAPLNEIRQRAAHAVPESSCFRMANDPQDPLGFNFRANQPYGHHISKYRRGTPGR